jgi:hypothetical protein
MGRNLAASNINKHFWCEIFEFKSGVRLPEWELFYVVAVKENGEMGEILIIK